MCNSHIWYIVFLFPFRFDKELGQAAECVTFYNNVVKNYLKSEVGKENAIITLAYNRHRAFCAEKELFFQGGVSDEDSGNL